MRNTDCRTWNMKEVENEKCTLQDQIYGKKTEKTWKMRQKHCMTWNMVRNTQKRGKRNAHSRTWSMARKLKYIENERKICVTWNKARNL